VQLTTDLDQQLPRGVVFATARTYVPFPCIIVPASLGVRPHGIVRMNISGRSSVSVRTERPPVIGGGLNRSSHEARRTSPMVSSSRGFVEVSC
jgi:hypothetical protein